MPFPSGLKLFSIIGQSNARGRGDIADWPENRPRNGDNIWTYKANGTWQNPGEEPIDGPNVGPGIAFADRLIAINPSWNIGLIPCAKSGSSISEWQPGDTLFDDAVDRIREAIKQSGGMYCGAILSQGEVDAQTRDAAQSWNRLAKRMINAHRRALSPVPFFLVQLGNLPEALEGDYPYWETVRAAQEVVANELNRVRLVSTDDLTLPADDIHWSTACQLVIGARAASQTYSELRSLGGRYSR